MIPGIFSLKGSEEPQEDFIVADIENEENGNVLAIGISRRDKIGDVKHYVFDNWSQFTEHVLKNGYTRVWAHNGGGWDWCSFFTWLLEHRFTFPKMEIFPVIVQTKYVVLQVDFNVEYIDVKGEIRRTCHTVRFCDSLYLMRSSLEDLSQKFLGYGKIKDELMAWDLYREDREKFYEYLRVDCENLLLILEKFYTIVREKICLLDRLGNTIGSTALRIFRTSEQVYIKIPTDAAGHKELRALLREGYMGGRVEVFKYGYHKKVNVYDINSLYPSVMATRFYPVNGECVRVHEIRRGVPGIYRIRFRQRNESVPPVLCIDGKSRYEGEGVFYSPEVELLGKCGAEIELIEGWVFCNSQPIFANFIQKMWGLRKSDYKGPLGTVCKFLMNSLYGKFCERPKTTRMMLLNGSILENITQICNYEQSENEKREEKDREKIRVDILDEKLGSYLITDNEAICVNEHVGIGGLITSWARVELYQNFLLTGLDNLVYCDTDSIHTLGKMKTGDELGELKHEHSGEGIYCGKKLYALRGEKDGKPYQKVTAKGVSFCSKPSSGEWKKPEQKFEINFNDFFRMLNGEVIQTEFSQPATAKEILKGRKPCQILKRSPMGRIQHNRKRRIRKT